MTSSSKMQLGEMIIAVTTEEERDQLLKQGTVPDHICGRILAHCRSTGKPYPHELLSRQTVASQYGVDYLKEIRKMRKEYELAVSMGMFPAAVTAPMSYSPGPSLNKFGPKSPTTGKPEQAQGESGVDYTVMQDHHGNTFAMVSKKKTHSVNVPVTLTPKQTVGLQKYQKKVQEKIATEHFKAKVQEHLTDLGLTPTEVASLMDKYTSSTNKKLGKEAVKKKPTGPTPIPKRRRSRRHVITD